VANVPLTLGIAARPYPGETVSGDGWSIDWHAAVCRIALIDGLGHGPEAAAATARAVEELQVQPELTPAEALRRCHGALHGLRGAAMSVARVDLAAQQLTFAGIGNVDARLVQGAAETCLTPYRGIIGRVIPTIRSVDVPLTAAWLLVLHTDGISTRFRLEKLPDWQRCEPQPLADAILQEWGRQTDDATVLVIRPSR
jgi:serine phosphatase RsbU (regulator of sigma subunit)